MVFFNWQNWIDLNARWDWGNILYSPLLIDITYFYRFVHYCLIPSFHVLRSLAIVCEINKLYLSERSNGYKTKLAQFFEWKVELWYDQTFDTRLCQCGSVNETLVIRQKPFFLNVVSFKLRRLHPKFLHFLTFFMYWDLWKSPK